MTSEFLARADELIAAGRFLFERGWVPATSGNFSARLSDGRLALTVSGRHKGRLTHDDVLLADAEGRSLDDRRPSAETALHVQLYRRFPEMQIIVGLWTSKTDPKRSLTRVSCAGPAHLVTSLSGARAEIQQIVRPLLFQRAIVNAGVRRGTPECVGR